MRARVHPPDVPRGRRDPRGCKVQTGGRLVFRISIPGVYEDQPMFWTDRPLKFEPHIRRMLRRPGTVITDIKWRQLGGRAWWRIPAWPDGEARS